MLSARCPFLPLNDIEVVPVCPLGDDVLSLDDLPVEHGVEDLVQLLGVQGAEEQDALHGLQQTLALDIGLRVDHLKYN